MAGLDLEAVSRAFSGMRVVDQLSLAVRDGELLVLVGPSGCGKTTTLRMVAGLERADAGEIRIGSQVVNRWPARRRNVAMVFQHPALYPHLSVYRNIVFGLERRESWRRWFGRSQVDGRAAANGQALELADRVQASARLLGIERLLERRPHELSGGERQRVALGRAIVRRPDVFLLDEPLASLDSGLRLEMRRLLADLHGRLRTTTVYVTHDQTEALTLGERIAVMRAGRIEQVGSPQDVYTKPRNRFVASFFGSPPMCFLAGELSEAGGRWQLGGPFGRLAVPRAVAGPLAVAAGSSVVLGLRAENVRLIEGNAERSAVASAEGGENERLRASVIGSEMLGDAQVVELELGESQEHQAGGRCVVTKVAAGLPIGRGDVVSIVVDFARAVWFSQTGGERIAYD